MVKPPFKTDDLVKYGEFEFIVSKCYLIADHWHLEGKEIHTKNLMGTAAKNCEFVNVSQGDLLGDILGVWD